MTRLWVALVLAAIAIAVAATVTAATRTIETTAPVDVTVWKHVDSGTIYLSTRPADGAWTTHNTPVDLSTLHSGGRFYQGSAIRVDVPVTVEVEIAEEATEPPTSTCTVDTYDRDDWGSYPGVPDGATATWTTAADSINNRGLTHDHHVALRDAHLSGGCHWDAERKDGFSSDPANLNPTTGSFNASKAARTPDQLIGIAARIIDTAAERCAYATQHRDVKAAYGLTMTTAEAATVEAWIILC